MHGCVDRVLRSIAPTDKPTPAGFLRLLTIIFREHQVGPADILVSRPRPDSLQIEHDSRAIKWLRHRDTGFRTV